mgnify:CR=1 FL=1
MTTPNPPADSGSETPLCNHDKKPCPAPIEGKGRGLSRCEQNGVCQRVDFNNLPTLELKLRSETPETKEDYAVLTAWIEVNPPSKPSLREPVKCIRLTTYERLERRLREAQDRADLFARALIRAEEQLEVFKRRLREAEERIKYHEQERENLMLAASNNLDRAEAAERKLREGK